jgi:hypothetical protein
VGASSAPPRCLHAEFIAGAEEESRHRPGAGLTAADLAVGPSATETALDSQLRAKREGLFAGRSPRYGSRRGESLRAVIDAYTEVGTYAGAARLLDKRKIPTRKAQPWRGVTVKSLVDRTIA